MTAELVPILVAATGALGALVGALIATRMERRRSRYERLFEARLAAYLDYWDIIHGHSAGDAASIARFATRIAILGSAELHSAYRQFRDIEAGDHAPEEWMLAWDRVLWAMRDDLGVSGKVHTWPRRNHARA